MPWAFGGLVFEDSGGGDGLELALVFVVELPAGQVVDQPDPAERVGGEYFGDQAGAGEVGGAVGDVQIYVDDLADGPAARRGDPLAVRFPVSLMD